MDEMKLKVTGILRRRPLGWMLLSQLERKKLNFEGLGFPSLQEMLVKMPEVVQINFDGKSNDYRVSLVNYEPHLDKTDPGELQHAANWISSKVVGTDCKTLLAGEQHSEAQRFHPPGRTTNTVSERAESSVYRFHRQLITTSAGESGGNSDLSQQDSTEAAGRGHIDEQTTWDNNIADSGGRVSPVRHLRQKPIPTSFRGQYDWELYLKNFPYDTKEDELMALFQEFKCVRIRIKKRDNGQMFGFATFREYEDAESAYLTLDRSEFKGRRLDIEFARSSIAPEEEVRRRLEKTLFRSEVTSSRRNFSSSEDDLTALDQFRSRSEDSRRSTCVLSSHPRNTSPTSHLQSATEKYYPYEDHEGMDESCLLGASGSRERMPHPNDWMAGVRESGTHPRKDVREKNDSKVETCISETSSYHVIESNNYVTVARLSDIQPEVVQRSVRPAKGTGDWKTNGSKPMETNHRTNSSDQGQATEDFEFSSRREKSKQGSWTFAESSRQEWKRCFAVCPPRFLVQQGVYSSTGELFSEIYTSDMAESLSQVSGTGIEVSQRKTRVYLRDESLLRCRNYLHWTLAYARDVTPDLRLIKFTRKHASTSRKSTLTSPPTKHISQDGISGVCQSEKPREIEAASVSGPPTQLKPTTISERCCENVPESMSAAFLRRMLDETRVRQGHLSRDDLPDNIEVLVVHVCDERHFWGSVVNSGQLMDEYFELCTMMEEVSKRSELGFDRAPNDTTKAGHLYQKTDWCRVWIESRTGTTARVFYIDYGNVDYVEANDLWILPRKSWVLRPMAVPFHVTGKLTKFSLVKSLNEKITVKLVKPQTMGFVVEVEPLVEVDSEKQSTTL